MAAYFTSQLDFILFFYGLAFILLGAVCMVVARGSTNARDQVPWRVLGTFAYLHGASEWLDLTALVFSGTDYLKLAGTAVMTISYVVLLDFARQAAMPLGFKVPGRWIYAPLMLLVVLGWHLAGIGGANTLARYAFGFPGAELSAVLLYVRARRLPKQEGLWLKVASVTLALYGVAAGLIVPPTPNWAGDLINYDMFMAATAVPIQLVRGLLACTLSFAVWAHWGKKLNVELKSARYSEFQRKQFYGTLIALGTIMVFGWVLTQVLGDIYKNEIEEEAEGDVTLIVGRLAAETRALDGMARALAGQEELIRSIGTKRARDRDDAKYFLTLDMEAAGADDGYVLDRAGTVLTATDNAAVAVGTDLSDTIFVKSAIEGDAGHLFRYDARHSVPSYYASYPIRTRSRDIIGVVVLKKSLAAFDADLKTFDRSFTLIDHHGVVLLTNRPEYRFRTLWPLTEEQLNTAHVLYGRVSAVPVIAREIYTSQWIKFNGEHDYVQRRSVDHGDWSLITWKAPQGIYASRVLGIIITLLMTIIALVYLVGREHWIHDNIQLEKRLKLEELARKLDSRATTDPLTGLFNRRKFDRALAGEIMRAHRYHSPLAMVMFDVDHFKKINDSHGHQVGDHVLIKLSQFVAGRLRTTDVLARWGGEEFVILCAGCRLDRAAQLAEQLRDEIAAIEFATAGHITCSFGVAEYVDPDTPETLLARADEALYRAKANGRNCVELAAAPAPVESPALQPAV